MHPLPFIDPRTGNPVEIQPMNAVESDELQKVADKPEKPDNHNGDLLVAGSIYHPQKDPECDKNQHYQHRNQRRIFALR